MKLARLDGWQNLFKLFGTRSDPKTHTTYATPLRLSEQGLTALYMGSGFARRIVKVPAGDMVRQWFEVEGDTDGAIIAALAEIKAKQAVNELTRWARLFGGAVLFMMIDDGQTAETPVNEGSIRSLAGLRVYDRHRVTWTTADVNDDPYDPRFGEIDWYTIQPVRTAQPFRVHHSRLIIMHGHDLPEQERERNDGWGQSVLETCYTELRNQGIAYSGAATTIDDFIQTVLSVEGLQDMIASGQEDVIKTRLDLLDMSRSMLNTVVLDSNEQYSKHASTVTGLADLIDRFGLALAAVSGIPYSKLMGETVKGLNSTGDADTRNYYDDLKQVQENDVLPACQRLVNVEAMALDGAVKGVVPAEGFPVQMRPLWQMSDVENATYRKTVAETDGLYMDHGVLDPDEVRQSRFGGDAWSQETELDEALRDDPLEEDA